MIAFIKGTVDSLSEGKMILESHGIGYELNIPASMFDAGIREGEELKIYTHMSVREDGISLFGFLSREDLEIYRMLIGVSGIGPKAALAVLSTLTADNLRFAVLSEDVQAIAKTPGIGKKTAQKLILELKTNSTCRKRSSRSWQEIRRLRRYGRQANRMPSRMRYRR